jgi:protein O-GlcNAc transferase
MLSNAERMLQQGAPEQALPLLVEYCACHSGDARAWFLLGVCQHQTGKLENALQSLERAISIEPRYIHARSARAAVLCDLGRQREALHVYRKALHLAAPGEVPQLLVNMGVVMEQMGDDHGALERYEQALRHQPEFASALLNRGALLIRLGRLDEALGNNQRLAELNPAWAEAQYNLGEALLALSRWEEALVAYERALAVNPAAARPHFARGLALSMLCRFDEAQHAFDTAKALDPAAVEQCIRNAASLTEGEIREIAPKVIYLLKGSQRLENCDWTGREEFVASFAHLIESSLGREDELTERALAFRSLSLSIPATTRLALVKSISAHIVETVKAEQHPGFIHKKRNGGKLRIGYVSPDFRVHPTAMLTRRLYALHDREQFEVHAYALTPDDGSEIRRDIASSCGHFRDVSALGDFEVAAEIHGDGIQILVDLAGYTTYARTEIFAMQPAPIQVAYLGFPHSMGASFIDYYLADQIVAPPGAERFFTEKLVYLPDSYFMFNNQHEISSRPIVRAEFGLPDEGFVFCCFNSNYKIEPEVFEIWMQLLKRVPGSILWLLRSSESVVRNLSREAELRGVSADRLIFSSHVPNEMHVARYRLADLFLDTFSYNAHTTAAEALWAGLPVLTCPGKVMSSRVAASLLTSLGLAEMIAHSPQQYEERAYYLAVHADELTEIREKLAENRRSMPLFDSERQVRNLEAAYQAMWRRHEAGQPPESFRIADR